MVTPSDDLPSLRAPTKPSARCSRASSRSRDRSAANTASASRRRRTRPRADARDDRADEARANRRSIRTGYSESRARSSVRWHERPSLSSARHRIGRSSATRPARVQESRLHRHSDQPARDHGGRGAGIRRRARLSRRTSTKRRSTSRPTSALTVIEQIAKKGIRGRLAESRRRRPDGSLPGQKALGVERRFHGARLSPSANPQGITRPT